MQKYLLLFLLFSLPVVGAEKADDKDKVLQGVVKDLDDRDFEVREDASRALVNDFPSSYIKKYILLSDTEGVSPEVRVRLRVAAKKMYIKKVLPTTTKYRKLFAEIGFSYQPFWSEYYKTQYGYSSGGQQLGIIAGKIWPFGAADEKLKRWDVIVNINGENTRQFYGSDYDESFLAGKEYKLEVYRYKDIKEINKRGFIIRDKDEYDKITITIKAHWKTIYQVDADKLSELTQRYWWRFASKVRRNKVNQK